MNEKFQGWNDKEEVEMDWYTWLLKTNLDPILVYEYGLVLTKNELQGEDMGFLNHEILQSMGIAVAKHRLEILKLARRETAAKPKGLKSFVSAINKTKKLFAKKVFVNKKQLSPMPVYELTPPRPKPGGMPVQFDGRKENDQGRSLVTRRGMMNSGPLDSRLQEKVMVSNRNISLSGPLNRRMHEGLMNMGESPKRTVQLDGNGRVGERYPAVCKFPIETDPVEVRLRNKFYSKDLMSSGGLEDIHSIWSFMYQDMKPT